MRLPIVVLTSLLLAAPVLGGPLRRLERQRAMSELHATRKLFLDAITGLTPAQWNYRPAPGRWSIGEIAEHVALTEDLYFGAIQKALASRPPAGAKSAVKDDEIIPRMADRASKRQAVAANTPNGRWKTAAEVSAHFKKSRDRLIKYVETTNDDLRGHFREYRALGLIDAYQWTLVACGHVDRHVQQIREVQASPGYPR